MRQIAYFSFPKKFSRASQFEIVIILRQIAEIKVKYFTYTMYFLCAYSTDHKKTKILFELAIQAKIRFIQCQKITCI